ncbi:Serine/threonine-protein kinase PknD [Streptomyces sp. RB17]|uniref:serine/threonine-protein kinase n=1 Tax=Streptomyces sp. RB17 TaxID=2585197 RepID=UPI001306E339|nr:protein kinase [Streptomyces sp. RB17]MQY37316.1 Serine/threonine-protein kinase PknD [Streptomyces sp. RB17]
MSTAGSPGRVQPARPGDPSRIGPYRIIGRLGAGGMGTVHAGLTADGLRVAVKVIHPAQAEDPEFRARFRREVQLSARVQGPCLVPLLAADPEAAAPWLATAYAPGPTLNQYLADHGPLTGGTLYAFAAGTAQALAAIHAAGVVHRDVKPQNVILGPAGPRVLDFGIARAADGTSVTRTGVMTGTPGWISPEYYRTSTAGPEGDLFAWGALVAHAATGRLPFGVGAPDAVAFRVMSGEPDLDGVPEALLGLVRKALAKEPAERPAAASLAEECTRLLAGQATQVLDAAAGAEPTRVGELVTAQWHIPAPDDPTWHPPAASSRRRALLAVLVAAVLVGASAGGALALRTGGHDDSVGRGAAGHATAGPAGASATTRAGGAAHVTPPSPTPGGTTASPTDPRRVAIPVDPLAGISGPAFTRAGDESEPTTDEWRASAAASTAQERAVERAVRADVTAMLATKHMDFMTPTVTFNKRAQTVMVTGGPVSQLPDDDQGMFERAGEMAACTALAHRLQDEPRAWPYGRYVVAWRHVDGDPEPDVLGFGEATDGCLTRIAGQWQGDQGGLAAAGIPSSDKAEIRVADAADKAITAEWNSRIAQGDGLAPFSDRNAISLGFDPVERAAYVWARDTNEVLVGRAQRDNFQDAVSKTLCPKLTAEFHRNPSWNYTRWSVAVYEPDGSDPELVRSGECLP